MAARRWSVSSWQSTLGCSVTIVAVDVQSVGKKEHVALKLGKRGNISKITSVSIQICLIQLQPAQSVLKLNTPSS